MLVVVIEPHVHTLCVAVVVDAAGVAAGVAVYSCFQPFGVYVFHHGLQAVGEACLVYEQFAGGGVASAEEAVVDVDVVEAYVLQTI